MLYFSLKRDFAGKGFVGVGGGLVQRVGQELAKAAGVVEGGLHRGVAVGDGGFPADFDAGEQIGLGADHLVEAGGFQGLVAEDLGIGVEGEGGAAAVRGGADLLDRAARAGRARIPGRRVRGCGRLRPGHGRTAR